MVHLILDRKDLNQANPQNINTIQETIFNQTQGNILRITSLTDFDEELIKEGTIKSTDKDEY